MRFRGPVRRADLPQGWEMSAPRGRSAESLLIETSKGRCRSGSRHSGIPLGGLKRRRLRMGRFAEIEIQGRKTNTPHGLGRISVGYPTSLTSRRLSFLGAARVSPKSRSNSSFDVL